MHRGGSLADGKNWIKGSIKHPGALRRAAKKRGLSTRAEASKEKHSSNKKIRARGQEALTLMGFHH